mmetsp:Transcript_27347/g.65012  ORF Transcript_27347/g.65012 Transcript_27347/m.65012 type:complete len:347 (+) Transcript_27347:2266-3306(+)
MIQLVTEDQNATAVRIGLKKSRKDGGVCSEAHSQHQGILLLQVRRDLIFKLAMDVLGTPFCTGSRGGPAHLPHSLSCNGGAELIDTAKAKIVVGREVHALASVLRELQVIERAEQVSTRPLSNHNINSCIRGRGDGSCKAIHVELVHVLQIEICPSNTPLLSLHVPDTEFILQEESTRPDNVLTNKTKAEEAHISEVGMCFLKEGHLNLLMCCAGFLLLTLRCLRAAARTQKPQQGCHGMVEEGEACGNEAGDCLEHASETQRGGMVSRIPACKQRPQSTLWGEEPPQWLQESQPGAVREEVREEQVRGVRALHEVGRGSIGVASLGALLHQRQQKPHESNRRTAR